MTIESVKYLENGYFGVMYSNFNTEIIQDITAIKMQFSTDERVKDIMIFLRRIKLEKITEGDKFDELKYRNYVVVADKRREMELLKMKQLASQMVNKSPSLPKSKFGNTDDLDELLKALL
jgi:hypothetical protein